MIRIPFEYCYRSPLQSATARLLQDYESVQDALCASAPFLHEFDHALSAWSGIARSHADLRLVQLEDLALTLDLLHSVARMAEFGSRLSRSTLCLVAVTLRLSE
jgi:hypothetical protein